MKEKDVALLLMGCLKLTYGSDFETPLKIVHRRSADTRKNGDRLYYYGARYYAAWIGRFCSVDPQKEQRTWVNPYNYVQNNPINRTDPTGAVDDWFESESGAVRHVDITEKELTIEGEKYKNIGITHTAQIAGDNKHVHYYQDKPFAITDKNVPTSKLLAKHDGMYKKVMGMATERDQKAIFDTRTDINTQEARMNTVIGTFGLPFTLIGGTELAIAGAPVAESVVANAPRVAGQAYVNATRAVNAVKSSQAAQVGKKILNTAEYFAGKFMNETWAGKLITSTLASEVDPGAVSNTNVYTDLLTNLYKAIKEIQVEKLDDTAILKNIYQHPAVKEPNYSQTK